MGQNQATAGSEHIAAIVQDLCRFQQTSLSAEELQSSVITQQTFDNVAIQIPAQEQLKSIKSQQASISRERERMIQGIQEHDHSASHNNAVRSVLSGFGEQDVHITDTDSENMPINTGPTTTVRLGPSTSYLETGRQVAEELTLNHRQSIAFRLICRHLDLIRHEEDRAPQLCQFVGGEGGTGKSRIIQAVAELFVRRSISHRLLVTATSGTAAARINGITIHSACKFSKDASHMGSGLYINGETRMLWKEKYMLIVDEVSMLGARTLYLANEQLCRLRGCSEDFGGIPIVLFCGDFHQFRPVQERTIILPSVAFPWDQEKTFRSEQRLQHEKAHALWRKFTTVVILNEQVRAAGDPRLQCLLKRLRKGVQDHSDLDLINSTCYRECRRIPWETGITAVTPLNKNRWNLNFEATLSFRAQHQGPLRIFLAQHTWKEGKPTEEEVMLMLKQGDETNIPVPGIFLFTPGMPVVVNDNTYQGLKLVNGATFKALEIIVDKSFPGFQVSNDVFLHFGPPAGIILAGESTEGLNFVGMPPGTLLLTPITTKIQCQRKRPWQQHDVTRKGLPCTAAFACTDYKVQGCTLDRAALQLHGARTTTVDGQAIPSQCEAYSLYVQLSRCTSLEGMMLLSEMRERDFVGNVVPDNMVSAEKELDLLSDATVLDAESWDW